MGSPLALSADERPSSPLSADLYLKAQIEKPAKISKLKPGDVVEGKLLLDVYSGNEEFFSAGSKIRLTVDRLERRRRIPNDRWPWVIKFFTPRHQNSPTFESGRVTTNDGKEVALRVHLLVIGEKFEVRAAAKKAQPQADLKAQSATDPKPEPGPKTQSARIILTLEGTEVGSGKVRAPSAAALGASAEITAGTGAKLILLDAVSASGSQPGDLFQARLVEPVRVGAEIVLPEGSLFEGKVLKRAPPRILSRSGSLLLTFTQVSVPGGTSIPVAASLSAAELDQRSHTKMDPEGKLRGDRPGKAWMLVNIGATAGIAKVADDGTQLVIEAIVSTATDASTAGTARIVAMCGSGLFLLTRHGRDVVLPKFTEINIVFDRPVSLPPPHAATATP
jgi:hypothetical protein